MIGLAGYAAALPSFIPMQPLPTDVVESGRRSILITGGGRGLGRALAERLALDGATVGLMARTASELDDAVASIRAHGGHAHAYPGDVREARRLTEVAADFAERAGGLDGLVCAAGRLGAIGPLAHVDLDAWRADYETAILGAAHAIRAAHPYLSASRRGSIVVLVGPGHAAELAYASAFATAQAGLARLVETLAVEFAADGILIHALNPGIVPTALIRRVLDSPEGRRLLPRIGELFAEGKEVDTAPAAEMAAWLLARRPTELNGRVVAALATPEILAGRLARIKDEHLGVLRLR